MQCWNLAFKFSVLAALLCPLPVVAQDDPIVPPVVTPDETAPDEPTPAETAAERAARLRAEQNAGQSPANPFPQLQDTPTQRPGAGSNRSRSPDFLQGLQLADTGRRGRQSHQSLLAPAQFHGHVFGSGGAVSVFEFNNNPNPGRPPNQHLLTADLPIAGGNAAFSIADNNKPLPQDRMFFDYRHYNNAGGSRTAGFGGPPVIRRQNFDNFLFGLEKIIDQDGLVSVEVRIPFSGNANASGPGFGFAGGDFGNIPVTWKQSIFLEDSYSIVAGSSVVTPTGGDAGGQVFGIPLSVTNQAWHLVPFVGALLNLDQSGSPLLRRTSLQFFGQVDFPLNDQEVVVGGVLPGGFRQAMTMSLDGAIVFNLCKRPEARMLTRLDGSVELHYVRNIGGGDDFIAELPGQNPLVFSQGGIQDLLNLTAGLSAEICKNTRLQVAAAVPLSSSNNRRAFDSELIVSLNRFF